jgi:putative oxidoreductase
MKIALIVLRVIAALILLQTLYFKFTGHPESIFIFEKVGMEPWGRLGSGIVELIAGIALFVPRTIGVGALLMLGTMSGAIFMHLTTLGIEVRGDKGMLFYMAVFCWIIGFLLTVKYKSQIPVLKNLL